MTKKWKISQKVPDEFVKQFPEYSPLILQLLHKRNLMDQNVVDEFFNPDYEADLHNPFLMKGMDLAVERIFQAIENREKILVFGDYDADGITASVVLVKTFETFGARPEIYIPDRSKEGYGLNLEAIKKIKKNKIDLIVTVDCGISDVEEVDLANDLGIDVIITDHHWVGEKLPSAFAILNPKQNNCKYPFKELAGVGVAYKLAQALISKSKTNLACRQAENKKQKKGNLNNGFEKWLLDLVAVGTIADRVSLLGENRTLVKYGLIVLGKTQRIGFKELMKKARISNKKNLPLETEDVGFMIAPRLNAAGRMDHANCAYELLVSELSKEAEKLSEKLEKQNYERQKITEKIVKEIEARLTGNEKFVFEGDKNWPVGVIGLAASKIADNLHRPILIFSKKEKESSGSGRSIDQFNLIEALNKCGKCFKEFGGHKGAVGFTLKNSKLKEFKKQFGIIVDKELKDENLIPVVNIDAEIFAEDVNWNIYDQIVKFSPFGQDNPKPLFLVKNLKISQMWIVGNNGKHLKLKLVSSANNFQRTFDAIGFSFGECEKKIHIGDSIDVVFEFIVDEWNGTRQLQLKIVDLRKH